MSSSPTSATSVRHYSVDKRVSQFTVQAFASGLISAVAHSPKIAIRDWTCEIVFDPQNLRNSYLKANVNAAAFQVLDELRETDRRELVRVMNNEVLETGRYPSVEFSSTDLVLEKVKEDLYRSQITGSLRLHGTTNTLEFPAEITLGPDTVRAHGAFTLLQSDYNMKIASIAGGNLQLRDEVKFNFFIVARKLI